MLRYATVVGSFYNWLSPAQKVRIVDVLSGRWKQCRCFGWRESTGMSMSWDHSTTGSHQKKVGIGYVIW